jgi:hypothetical protein
MSVPSAGGASAAAGPIRRLQPAIAWWPAWAALWILAVAAVESLAWRHPAAGFAGGWALRSWDHVWTFAALPLLLWRWTRVPGLLLIVGCTAWQLGMHELDRLRGGTVGDDELAYALLDADCLSFVLRMLREPLYAGAILAGLALLAVPPWLLTRWRPRVGPWVLAAVLLAAGALSGCRWHLDGAHAADPAWRSALRNPGIRVWRYLATLSAGPWRLDQQAAAQLMAWEDAHVRDLPPDPALAGLQGRYPGRSVVIVLLESHRAAHVDGYRARLPGFADGSPHLSRRLAQGVAFADWRSQNYKTASAVWGILSGLPEPLSCCPPINDPAVEPFSPWRGLRDAGWHLSLHQAGPLRFENTIGILSGLFTDLDRLREDQAAVPPDHLGYWGMDDEILFAQARRRIEDYRAADTRFALFVQTVAAHRPYDYPHPADEPADHAHAMAYTDRCLEAFLGWWDTLPAADRPLVLITADHGYADGLPPGDELALTLLPGLLLTPDGFAAGRTVQGTFCHGEIGGLLAGLVGVPWPRPTPFAAGRRAVLARTGDQERAVIGQMPDAEAWTRQADACWRRTP